MKLYFGGESNIDFLPNRPLFLTPELRWGAYWYAIERSDLNPTIYEIEASFAKAAKVEDVVAATLAVGATAEEVFKASGYEGDNPLDFSYLPRVQEELARNGFDAIEGEDVLSNSSIPVIIIWNPKQINVLRQCSVSDDEASLSPLIERTEFGFTRTIADGPLERLNCKYMPGYLVPADLSRMAGNQDLETWAMTNLLASAGATVARFLPSGGMQKFQIRTLVPARSPEGHCLNLCDSGCSIHAVAPFGCAFFDTTQTKEEANRRSEQGLRAIAQDWTEQGPYSRIWIKLEAAGKRAIPANECRAKIDIGYERLKRKGKI